MPEERQQRSIAQTLPSDVLCELYELCARLEPFQPYTSSFNYNAKVTFSTDRSFIRRDQLGYLGYIRLTHVCRSWRIAGIELCAKLWAGINILGVPYDALETVIARARDLPLLATTGAYQSGRESQRDFEIVIQHIHRLRELNFTSALRLDKLWAVLVDYRSYDVIFERLETLACLAYEAEPQRHLRDRVLNAPNLRRLTISNPYIPFFAPRLTHFSLDCQDWATHHSQHEHYNLSTLICNLQTTTGLQDLELRFPVRKSLITSGMDISVRLSLPYLQCLRLAGHITHCADFLSIVGLSPRMSVRMDASIQPDREDDSLYTSLFESILPGLQYFEHEALIMQPMHEPPSLEAGNAPGPHIGFGLVRNLAESDAPGDIRVSVSPYGSYGVIPPPWQRRVVASAFFDVVKPTVRVLDISHCNLWQELAPALPDGVFDRVHNVTTDIVHCGFLRYGVCTRDPPLLPSLREVVIVGVVEHPSEEQWQVGWASIIAALQKFKRAGKPVTLRRIKGIGSAPRVHEQYGEVDREGLRCVHELALEVVDEYADDPNVQAV